VRERLVEFMGARAGIHAEGAVALFEQAMAWLRRERVLLPGVRVLARLVATVREDTDQRIYQTLAEAAAGADVELPLRLRDLLELRRRQRRLRQHPTVVLVLGNTPGLQLAEPLVHRRRHRRDLPGLLQFDGRTTQPSSSTSNREPEIFLFPVPTHPPSHVQMISPSANLT
jgi:hypothetical protein